MAPVAWKKSAVSPSPMIRSTSPVFPVFVVATLERDIARGAYDTNPDGLDKTLRAFLQVDLWTVLPDVGRTGAGLKGDG